MNVFPQIAEKVKLFYFEYARNRHKMTTITPSYHAVRRPFRHYNGAAGFLTRRVGELQSR